MNLSRYRHDVVNFLTIFLIAFLVSFSFAKAQSSTPLTNFPTFSGGGASIRAIAVFGTTIYVGGDFTSAINSVANGGATLTRNNLAAIDAATGAILPWDPNVNASVSALTINAAGTTIYAGGNFTTVNGGTTRNYAAAFNNSTGVANTWNPNANGTVTTLVFDGTFVYAAGVFSTIGGQSRQYIAQLNATGTGTATTWRNGGTASGAIGAIAVSGTNVYVGGSFTTVDGQPRNRVALFTGAAGTLDATWNPNSDAQVNELFLNGTTLYAGGSFGNIGGAARNRIAALSTTGAGAATTWNPNPPSGGIFDLATNGAGTTVYAGGLFSTIGGAGRMNIAALDATVAAGTATAWDPNPNLGGTVRAVVVSGPRVYIGGDFTTLGGSPRVGFAAFGPLGQTFYFQSGDPNTPGNWDTNLLGGGTDATVADFTTAGAGNTFVIPNGRTATLTNNLDFGNGTANPVTLRVENGGTLNTGIYAVRFAGDYSSFDLQAGVTLQTSNVEGINGTANNLGAVQITAPTPASVYLSYSPTANYNFSTLAASQNTRIGAFGNKPAITQAANITINSGGTNQWQFSSNMTLSGILTVQSGQITIGGGVFTLNAAGSIAQNGTYIRISGGQLNLSNPNILSMQSGSTFGLFASATIPAVLTNYVTYDPGSLLQYFATTARSAGYELPSPMDGNVQLFGASGGPIALSAPTTLNGTLDVSTNVVLTTSAANMLTVANSAATAVSGPNSLSGGVDGPMRRAIPAGANTGTWLFPFSKGGANFPFAIVNPTTAGGAVVEAEAFNNNPSGTGDGTTIQAASISTTEYWRASVVSGSFTNGRMQLGRATLAATQTVGSATSLGGPYSAIGTSTYNNSTIDDLTQNTAQGLSSPNFFAVGTQIIPTPQVVPASLSPARNANAAGAAANINVVFDQNMNTGTYTAAKLIAHGNMRGKRTNGAYTTVPATTVNFPATPVRLPNELVTVTVTNATSAAGSNNRPFVYQFRTAAAGTGTGNFVDARRYPTGSQPLNSVAGQFDNVAGVDFAVANFGTNTITVYRNDGTGNFPPATNIVTVTVGSSPFGLETGDFDNDGDTDIIVVCLGSVWLVQNNNNGTYTPSSVITSTYARLFAAVTDFNADGNLDIVFGNNCCGGTPGAQVYLGNGSGGFTFSQTIVDQVSDYIAPKVADMDGDGDMDILYCFDTSSKGIRIYNNDGTGKFDGGTQVVSGTILYNFQVGDLNGDTYPDIVYTTLTLATQNVNIMLRAAPFTAYNFTTTSVAIPSAVSPVTQLADVDADGDLDIVAVRSTNTGGLGHAVVTLQNTGTNSGTFSVFATSPLVGFSGNNASNGLFNVSAADFDGDGDLDLVIPKMPDNQVAVVLNQNPALLVTGTTPAMNTSNVAPTAAITPTYNLAVTAATHSLTGPIRVFGSQSAGRNRTGGGSWAGATFTPNNIPTLTRAYFPGEKVDVVISSAANVGVGLTPFQQGTTRQFFVQAPTATPGTFVQGNSYTIASAGQTISLGDFDANGMLDAATANYWGGNSTSILYGTGAGTFNNEAAPSPYTLTTNPSKVVTGDFNNDGRADLAFGHNGAAAVRVMLSNGATFNAPVNYVVSGTSTVLTVADFNGDGNQDIAVKRYNTTGVDMLFGNGDGTFRNAMQVSAVNGMYIESGDFNNDGYIDLIVSYAAPGNTVECLLNDGTGMRFTAGGSFSAGGTDTHTIAVADFDGNGNLDFAVSNFSSNNVVVFRGNGNGTFQAADAYSTGAGTAPRSIVAGDFNGDGRTDIAAAGFGNSMLCILLRNAAAYAAGSAFAPVAQYGTPYSQPHGIAAGDLDGDGDIDLAVNYNGTGQVTVFLNAIPINVQNNAPPFGVPPVTPAFNTMNAAATTDIYIPFSANLNAGTVTAPNFRIHGTLRGMRSATYGVAPANTATLTGITSSFLPNERVFVSVTNAQNSGGVTTRPFVTSFRAASGLAPGAFHQTTAVSSTGARRVVYGHFNADAFIDMAVAGTGGIELFTGAATGLFTSAGMIAGSAGTSYYALATADMDNNGTLDIIGGYSGNTRTVRVFTNNGAAVFTALAPLAGIGVAATININDLAVADFNADGLMDVAVVCGGNVADGNYAVLRNTGGGVLAVQQTAASTNIYGVDVGDIDGDGDIDIAYTRWSAGEIFTLINDGRGNFYAGQTLVFGTDARSVRLGDVNNDGRLDLVVVQGGPSNLRIFLNSGTATTYPGTASQTVAFGAWATDVQLFDADGDNYLDAVATEDVGGRLVFFKNNAGTFAAPTSIYGFPNLLFLAAADIDNDGDVDLAASANNGSVHVLKYGIQPTVSTVAPFRNGNTTMNNPNIAAVNAPATVNFLTNITGATFTVPPAQQLFQVHGSFTGSRTRSQGFSPNGAYSGGAAAMTFTPSANFRPGELVSVSVTNASSSVTAPNNSVGIRTRPFVFDYRVAAGMGPANFSVPALGSPFGAGAAARSAAFGDVDGDGDLDIATANQTGTNVTVLANNGSGSYTAIAGSPFAVGGALRSLVFGDVDRDGDLDLVITRIGLTSVVVLLNNGSGSFTTSAIGSPFTVGTSPWYVALGDVDGDGDLDLATANNGSNDVTLLLNNGVGTFTPAPGSPIALGSTGASGIDFGDVDGDGDLDFAVANNGSTNVAVLLNNGTGLYAPAVGSPFTVGTSPRSVTFGDVDGDGDLDIATTNQTSNDVTVLLNNGAGSYSPSPGSPFAAGTQPIFLAFGDVDGDGDLDLATANQSSNNLTVLLNNGAGTFAAAANSPFAAGTQPNSVAFGDVDGDGDLDLAAANNGSNNVTVLFNQVASTKYYYQSGDAGLPGSWNSMPNGSGSSATSFNSPATDFYVMGGGASTTATVNTSFTLGANVSLHVTTPSVLALNGGVTITNNGFLNVSGATLAGATLRLSGTAAIAGNAVTYWGTTATLEYSGAAARATSAIEFPAAMPGSVTMNNTGGVTLHANRQINGTFTMQSGSLDISGRTLQPNGVITFAAGTINGNATSALTITGSGNINGNALFGAGGIGTLTMNRAGATMTLGSPLDIANTGSLFLTQGYIRTTPTNILSILNTAPASVFAGSGTTSHIAGPLRRSLAAVGGIYDFPVGGGTPLTYIPLQVSYASAAGTASYEVEPFLAASGGTEAGVIGTGTLSTTEYWRTFLGGFALVNATLTFTRTIPALIGTSRIGEAATAGGVYQGINTNTLSTVAAPNISNTMVYTPLNPGTLFYAIGAAAAPPVVTAVSPTRNNPAVAPLTSPVNVTFSQTLTALGMRTWNGFTGRNLTAPTFAGNTATQTGMNTRPGERVMTTITATGTSSAAGFMTTPHVSSFMGRAGTGPATFTQTSLTPTPASVWGIKVGYFNNDTNLDVALSTDNPPASSFRIFTGDGTGNFTPWYNATLSGGTPQGRGLAVADFNNDGRPDAAVGNILTGTVEVFINNAGATMNVGPVLPAFSVFDVTVGDFNGDGNIDIAATGYGAGQLFVYFGDGLGGFAAAPSSPYAIGTPNAAGISTDYFDNDGDMDIVVNTNVSLHIFANNGAGVFSQTNVPTTYTTLYGVLLTADFDNDGDIDILPTGLNPAGMTIYQNNGAGAFTGVSFAGNSPLILSMGDFNGDGLIDILNSVGSIPYFSQNINTAAGTLAFAPQRIIPNPANVSLGVAGDVDNDGDLDVIATAGTQFAFLRNAPYQNVVNNTFPFGIPPVTPTFNLMNAPVATTIVVPFTQNVTSATASAQAFKVWGGFTGLRTIGTYTTGVANATLTPSTPFRSGEQVWVSVTHAQSSLNVPTRPFVMGFRTRAGVGPATFQQVTIPTMLTGPRSIATGDFDGNGTLDFAATNGSSNNVTILISTGGGTYSASTVTVGANPQCVMPGDFDNDGDLDLAVADGANNVSLLRNTAGVFAAWGPVLVVGALPQAIAVGDYDADGDLDLATVNLTGNNISILLNTGAGAFAGAVNYALSGGSNPEFITTGDFDNDGDLDLATANYGTNTVSILINSGFGTFALTGNFPVGTQPQFITAADLNGDGNLDLATANAGGGGINDISILVNSNVTPGTFAAVNYAVGAGTVAVMPGDFDGDGDLDLTVANGGNVSMMRNTGGVFALATNNVLGGQPFSLVTGDFDNDGDIDAAAVNFGPDNVAILLNQNSPTRAGFGNALTFNGTTQDVAATNPAFDISAGTLETWIRPTWVSGAPPANPCIMAIRDGVGNTRYSFHIMSNYSGLAIWNGSLAFFPYPFAQNQWYHIAVTLTGGAATLYVNGIQAGAPIPYGVGPATGGQVHIGWAPVSGEPWQGDIDEVRLWNTALQQTTINTYKGLEIGTTHPNWSNLLGYWRFNEYGGTSAADASGNGNTATLVNAPTSTISLAPVSMIADPTFAVPTTVSLPATVAVGLPTITQIAVPAPVFGSVAPAAGNPVNYTPFIAIPSGAVDNFNYQASDGTTTSQATVSVRYRPQLTGNSFAVAGLPTVLTAPVLNGGTSPFTWSWTPATPELSSTSIQFPTFTGLTPQSYTVQVTDALGFTSSAPVNVTVVPGAFYYTNGDAALPSQWRSFYGNGSPAPTMTIPGTTFIVMGSTVFGSTIATTVNNMVIGTGVTVRIQAPSVLTIADGTTLTNFGTLIVEGNSSTGGTLRLLGTGSIAGNAPLYQSPMSVLQYSGTNVQRSSSPIEFPGVMPGTVVVDENVTVVLDDHKTLSSA
ncbi:MAG: VCBS repeat-containing protein, partial [Candidatus Kapabacteria bacterium]|nr:VCBS repeat-containing protein [Candidatus Kapabacteria bacterium]